MRKLAIPLLWLSASVLLAGQGRGQQAPPPTGKAAAPIDLTGYWVSIITKDWRYRMVMPAKGDYASVPVNAQGRRVADAWDPAKDEAAGEQCKAYGAPGVMRMPVRLHITWKDDTTLNVDMDTGQQTRLLHFGNWKAPDGPATWQGNSVAQWEMPRGQGGILQGGVATEYAGPKNGDLKVVTTHLRPGYLRKNGVPYSADTVLTEYWDLFKDPRATQWLVITTAVNDPTYLNEDWVTSLIFKKERDGSKRDPSPCSTK